MNSASKTDSDGWLAAVQLFEAYLSRPRKVGDLMSNLSAQLPQEERRRCQFLLYGVIRNLGLIARAINSQAEREPRRRLKSILFVGAAECLGDSKARIPEIVDHAVGATKHLLSSREAKFVNAVLRRAAVCLAKSVEERHAIRNLEPEEFVRQLSHAFSHPLWLVRRWRGRLSEDSVRKLVEWNQKPAINYLYLREGATGVSGLGLVSTGWPGFYRVDGLDWNWVTDLISRGKAFVTDPANRVAVELLDPRPGEAILDLCAAPGGKSLLLSENLKGSDSLLVSLDRPGPRMGRLRENLGRVDGTRYEIVESDLFKAEPASFLASALPMAYDGVLLDAPCSNTGVLRRRPDAKWRLQEDDISCSATLQLDLLSQAARFVKPGGRLVYNTCTLEPEENEEVVEPFVDSLRDEFQLVRGILSRPWIEGHDGGGAFRLERKR